MESSKNSRIVHCVGVWDLFHCGHLRFLQRAAACGDSLIVGVETDGFVKQRKGKAPIIGYLHRMEIINALRFVSSTIPYSDRNYYDVIKHLNANIYVIGEEYECDGELAQMYAQLRNEGIKIIVLPYTKSISTTAIKLACLKETEKPL